MRSSLGDDRAGVRLQSDIVRVMDGARRLLGVAATLALSTCSLAPTYTDSGVRCAQAAVPPIELTLERALPIDGPGDFEPSALLLLDWHLLTVSDKQDDVIFELEIGAERVRAVPYRRFVSPEGDRPLDLEGLTADEDGSLLVASEAHDRVLRVPSTGRASWATPSLEGPGRARGLFMLKHPLKFDRT